MTRKDILAKIEETYNKIYTFTDSLGDEALNILDEHTGRYNLSDEDSILMEAICDGEDPSSLSKDTLSCLLDAYNEALADLRYARTFGIDDLKNDNEVNRLL